MTWGTFRFNRHKRPLKRRTRWRELTSRSVGQVPLGSRLTGHPPSRPTRFYMHSCWTAQSPCVCLQWKQTHTLKETRALYIYIHVFFFFFFHFFFLASSHWAVNTRLGTQELTLCHWRAHSRVNKETKTKTTFLSFFFSPFLFSVDLKEKSPSSLLWKQSGRIDTLFSILRRSQAQKIEEA